MSLPRDWLVPDWPAPARVRAFVTTRAGGTSEGEYGTLNLGLNSGDRPENVQANRAVVRAHLPADPAYLAQVHGADVLDLDEGVPERARADAAVSKQPRRVAVVLTADCMPVFLCDRAGTRIAVAHAGWRGMAAGVLENAVAALGVPAGEVLAWMGPTIGPDAFEVGPEVREAFLARDPRADAAFRPGKPGKFMADLYHLARQRLSAAGVRDIHGGGFCTFHEPERFFSYRRVQKSGRMGAFIWIA
jgi:polyphenol oxidase